MKYINWICSGVFGGMLAAWVDTLWHVIFIILAYIGVVLCIGFAAQGEIDKIKKQLKDLQKLIKP